MLLNYTQCQNGEAYLKGSAFTRVYERDWEEEIGHFCYCICSSTWGSALHILVTAIHGTWQREGTSRRSVPIIPQLRGIRQSFLTLGQNLLPYNSHILVQVSCRGRLMFSWFFTWYFSHTRSHWIFPVILWKVAIYYHHGPILYIEKKTTHNYIGI